MLGLIPAKLKKESSLILIISGLLKSIWAEEKLESVEKQKVIEAMKAVTASSYDDYGRIPVSQLTAMARKIRGMDDYTVVALFHHHFYLFRKLHSVLATAA